MSENLRTACKWAVALPFLLLPISLTIDAPDVHGGYGIHLRQAGALAVAGATLAIMAGAWGRLEAQERARPWMTALLLLIPWLLVGHGLVVFGSWLADLVTAYDPSARQGGGGLKPWTRIVVALAAAAVGVQAGRKPSAPKVAGAMLVLIAGIAASRAIGTGATSDLGLLPELPALGAALLTAVVFRWHRGTLEGSPTDLAVTVVRLVLGAVVGYVSAVVLGAVGASMPAAWGAAGEAADVPGFALGWVALSVVAAWRLPSEEEPIWVLGTLGWGAASVLGGVATGFVALPEIVCFGIVVAILFTDSGPRDGPWKLALLGPVLFGLLIGAPLSRYKADGFGLAVAPATIAAIGSFALAAALGLLVLLSLERVRSAPLIGVLVSLLMIPVLLIYPSIAWGLTPVPLVVAYVAAVALCFHPKVPIAAAGLGLWYACFALVAVFKLGPSPADCAELEGELLLAAEAGAQPYDVIPTEHGVLASFKRIDRRGGYFEVVAPSDLSRRSRFETRRAEGDGPLWPERLERDPRSGLIWSQVLGIGAYGMWEVSVQPGPQLVVVRRRPIEWEPGNPVIDTIRNRLVLTYVPNRGAWNPLIQGIELDSLEAVDGPWKRQPRLEMADFVAFDEAADRFYVPAVVGMRGFVLNEYDGDLKIIRSRVQFHPSVGLAGDAGILWLTNPLGGTLEVLKDLEVIQTIDAGRFPRDLLVDPDRRRLYVGAYGSGDVHAYDINKDGTLTEASATSVGSLLRGIGLDPRTGDVYAASGCGVFRVQYRGAQRP
ncbi:MAG: lactonase family protein [Proteobacteria bacterium]|nr:lactonase family protein [Pseudomonadota bacterium]